MKMRMTKSLYVALGGSAPRVVGIARVVFFDKDGKARSVVDAFRKYALPLDRCDGNPRIWDFEDEDKQ